MRKNLKDNNKGITLIALAITIIVLVILAGVSIAALKGDNGIINEAKDAKASHEKSIEEEERELNEVESLKEATKKTELTENEASGVWEVASSTNNQISKYTGKSTEVYIPNKIGNTTINSVFTTAFDDVKKKITKLVVPGSIQLVSANFLGFSNLKMVVLQEEITNIPTYTFNGCYKLEYLSIPSTIKTIEKWGLACTGIKNIVIPNTVTDVGEEIFAWCSNPITIHCEAETKPDGWSNNWLNRAPDGTTVDWGYNQ